MEELRHRYNHDDSTYVYVTLDAHPDVLSLVPQFNRADAPGTIEFVAGPDSILIDQRYEGRATVAFYTRGEHSLDAVPKQFESYSLTFGPGTTANAANIATIGEWRYATVLFITDESNFMATLMHNLHELSTLKVLSQLLIQINDESYDKIDVGTVIKTLPGLYFLRVMGNESLSPEQIEHFVARSPLPDGWAVDARVNDIVFTKGYVEYQ